MAVNNTTKQTEWGKWIRALEHINRSEILGRFRAGDIFQQISTDATYGDAAIVLAAAECGMSKRSAYEYQQAALVFGHEERRVILEYYNISWSHIRASLRADNPIDALRIAHEHNYTAEEMRNEISAERGRLPDVTIRIRGNATCAFNRDGTIQLILDAETEGQLEDGISYRITLEPGGAHNG